MPSRLLHSTDALRLLRAVYSERPSGLVRASPGSLDEAVFALWSQQWPRLRRSFTFQTLTAGSDASTIGISFDLRIVLARSAGAAVFSAPDEEIEPWEVAALADLQQIGPTDFRQFIWRYGSDIRNGRDQYRFLAELYHSTRVSELSNGSLLATLSMVQKNLPDSDDGKTLKDDLVSCGRAPYSLLPPADPVDTIAFFVGRTDVTLPLPPPVALQISEQLWDARKDELIQIAERAIESGSPLRDSLLARLALLFSRDEFLRMTTDLPALRLHLVSANPTLLDSDDLSHVPSSELLTLLATVPSDSPLIESLLPRLIMRDDLTVANAMYERFPHATLRAAVSALDRFNTTGSLGSAWRKLLVKSRSAIFAEHLIEHIQSTRALAELATIFGRDHREVVQAGARPWAAALSVANDDVVGRARQVFLAFLIVVALERPEPGCEPLFEFGFETLHSELWHSRLSYEATSLLMRHLPELSFWQQWDNCLRLRRGVVEAYVKGKLDRNSFFRLTQDRRLMNSTR